MSKQLAVIGISMGDPAGIGPEIIAKAWGDSGRHEKCHMLVTGSSWIMEQAAGIVDPHLKIRSVRTVDECRFAPHIINVMEIEEVDYRHFRFGRVSRENGLAAYRAVEKNIRLALEGRVHATVTAPINKESIALAGIKQAGHTEIYANLTGVDDYTMLLVHENLRVVHVSTHVSMRQACDAVTKERLHSVLTLADSFLKQIGMTAPRIAVSGLNCHAGEKGLFGKEEVEIITPAVQEAREKGIPCEGPFPPDTVFARAAGGEFDLVVAMYHDQGHIPLKMLGFQIDPATGEWKDVSGVNITLGLPIIRTSVDHGTAFDKAGTGTASEKSLIHAIDYAMKLKRSM